ncbi:MAG: cation:proton antiporter subunit C [Defluviitaleaceae bacterium]|nr:cation:proton antiporter subunit C [Defluviitaleaceae bacterium]
MDMNVTEIVEILTLVLFFVGFYGLITTTNIVKSIVFISLIETAVVLFFLGIGYQMGIMPPIGTDLDYANVADPLPQALMITAVVIGLTGTAVNIVMFITIFRKYGTASWENLKNKNSEQGLC